MTNPTELLARVRAGLYGVTDGPWGMETKRTSCGVCHQVGPWPHKWRAGDEMSACIYDDYPSPPEGTDNMLANARFIADARSYVPALADALEAVMNENAALRARVAELEGSTKDGLATFDAADWFWRTMDPDDCGYSPEEAINRSGLGQFCVCEVGSSYSGPTRYGFLAPISGSDEDEFVHFGTQAEAISAAMLRIKTRDDE